MINRRLPWPVVLLALLPVMVQDAEGADASSGFSFLSSFLQMLAALALVIGLILLSYYIVTRLIRKIPALRPGNQHVRVVEVKGMGPRKALILIEVGGEYLLLASSGEQLTFIKQINMLEEIEVVEEPAEQPSFLLFLKRALSRS